MDAFPISNDHYEHLLKGKDETQILPQAREAADGSSAFYIASFVIKPEYSGSILRFQTKALQFYDQSYVTKPWRRICALAFTPRGEAWVQRSGMKQEKGDTELWYVDREMLPSVVYHK